MNFKSIVNQLLNERDEIGRAYRQVKSDASVLKGTKNRDFDIKGTYDRYKKAQDRANRLEKSYTNKVPVSHVIFPDRLEKAGTDMISALKYLLSKSDEEISVSVLKSWNKTLFEEETCLVLQGTTLNLHEWYPVDAYTSSNKKEKTSLYASDPTREKIKRYTGKQYDEGVTNLKDVTWSSFSVHIKRDDLEHSLAQFYQAKNFLESYKLKQSNAPKQTTYKKQLPNGKAESYELYPLTGYLKSYKDENGTISNFKEAEGVEV